MEGFKSSDANSLRETKNAATAAMLTHFKQLIVLVATPPGDGTSKDVAAAHGLQMELHSQGLVKGAEDLLELTRRLKELWLAGPLTGMGEGDNHNEMADNATKVGVMVEDVLKKLGESQTLTAGSK